MEKTNSNKPSQSMVLVAGMLVRKDQVEARLRALANGRQLREAIRASQIEKEKKLAEQGYSPSEIYNMRRAAKIEQMEQMGLGVSHRCRISRI